MAPVAFMLFGGLPGGFLAGFSYVVLHRALPRGLLGGLIFGVLLLIVVGVRIDPLRSENIDFAINGPGWLAVAVFTLLALATGIFSAAFAGRLSQAMRLPRWSTIVYLPLLVVLTVLVLESVWMAAAVLVGGAALFVIAHRFTTTSSRVDRGLTLLMRVAVAIVALLALPKFVTAIATIVE